MSSPAGDAIACSPATRSDLPALALGSRTAWDQRGEWLARLRQEFPHWGFLVDPFRGVWVGVRGRARIEVAPTAIELYDRLTNTRER